MPTRADSTCFVVDKCLPIEIAHVVVYDVNSNKWSLLPQCTLDDADDDNDSNVVDNDPKDDDNFLDDVDKQP